MNETLGPLSEAYRPKDWDDVIGQNEAVQRIRTIARRGYGGRSWWITGKSSIGKTTIAMLIAAEISDEFNIVELDAATMVPHTVTRVERECATFGMGCKTGRAVLINEAHALAQGTRRQLLLTLERIPNHVAWIFTTTAGNDQQKLFKDATDAEALVSRCSVIKLTSTGVTEAYAQHVKEIAQREGLDGKPIEAYEKLARETNRNLRAMISRVEAGEMMVHNNLRPERRS